MKIIWFLGLKNNKLYKIQQKGREKYFIRAYPISEDRECGVVKLGDKVTVIFLLNRRQTSRHTYKITIRRTERLQVKGWGG